MAKGLNKVMLIGNLGKDPELKYTSTGNGVCSFSLAVNEDYKNKDGEKVEHTEWINCTAWGKTAEIVAEYSKKGYTVYVEGKLRTKKSEGKDGGPDRWFTNVYVDRFTILKSPGGSSGGGGRPSGGDLPPPDDDIPF